MRTMLGNGRLLAATALCTFVTSPAFANDYGLQSTDNAQITNPPGTTLQGDKTGLFSTGTQLNLDIAGSIRGDGTDGFLANSNGGVIFNGGPAYITNSGTISGARFGISSIYVSFDPNTQTGDGRAIGSTLTNSSTGSIIGDSDDGVRFMGGGSVINSGLISGRVGAGADGISMFSYNGQVRSDPSSIGSVTNLAGGSIDAKRWGVILSGGGSVTNAGTITGLGTSTAGSVLIQGGLVFSDQEVGYLNNSGTLNGNVRLLGIGGGSTVINSGSITPGSAGSALLTDSAIALNNSGTITGFASGVFSSGGAFNINNSGTIRGNSASTIFSSPNAGVLSIGQAINLTNSGTISGNGFGVTTFGYFVDPDTGALSGSAIGSSITNTSTGSIIGDNDDGVRLIGGGTVNNSGYIAGRVTSLADGVSMFAYNNQDTSALPRIGTVNNLAGGTIDGNRWAVILSGGGTINNAGTLNGGTNGATLIQTGFINGKTGAVTNTGTINGKVQFNAMDSASVDNSGTIVSTTDKGITTTAGTIPLTVINRSGASITGATQGILTAGSSLTLDNAGTIRGNGNQSFFANSGGGVVLQGGPGFITNSGSISGKQFGITTIYVTTDPVFNGQAIGSTVTNASTGSIIGDNNDGIRLIGGGTVNNSGYIAGRVGAGADGISMFSFEGQDLNSFATIGSVTNNATGTIEGNRLGIILSNGGSVTNAGTINSTRGTAILIQAQGVGPEPARTGTVGNTGTINGSVGFNELASASITNSGSITGATSGILDSSLSLTVSNSGSVRGNGGAASSGNTDAGIAFKNGPANITNSGSISGNQFGVSSFYYFTDFTDPNNPIFDGRAIGSTLVNTSSGSIIGDNNDGVRFIGGGSVTNSGYIGGRVGAGADGISMFTYAGQTLAPGLNIGTVDNLAGGVIEGNRLGIIMSNGGTVNNLGTITGFTNGAILLQAQGQGPEPARTGKVDNRGTINGTVGFNQLASGEVRNRGVMSSPVGDAIASSAENGSMLVWNFAGGSITGASRGIFSEGTSLATINYGTIRGEGSSADQQFPSGGIVATGGTSGIFDPDNGGPLFVDNYGTISGKAFGITTAYYTDPQTQALLGRAVNSHIQNQGTIIGDNEDGIRLIGGGAVLNSGYIAGRVAASADGISILPFTGQVLPSDPRLGVVQNNEASTIEGVRSGVDITGGGIVYNFGTINGGTSGAINIRAAALADKRWGQVVNGGIVNGSITWTNLERTYLENRGTVTNFLQFDNVGLAQVLNTGSINAPVNDAIRSNSPLVIDNRTGGTITGAASGIFDHGSGMSLTNAGTIRGNGDVGVAADGGPANIVNSGTIYGKNLGILLFGRAAGSIVSNSGSIRSDNAPAVELLSGSVTNSGTIASTASLGVLIHSGASPTVANSDTGFISSVQLGNGGVISNSGNIGTYLKTKEGIRISASGPATASLVNSGTIYGDINILGAQSVSITNSASGFISLGNDAAISSNSQTTLNNSGTIVGRVNLSVFDDTVILNQGSRYFSGYFYGGNGNDTLRLTGTSNSPFNRTLLPGLIGFEQAQFQGGYWVLNDEFTHNFTSTSIANGTLQVNSLRGAPAAISLVSPIILNGNGTLAGTGIISGAVTVNSGGIVAPGGITSSGFAPIGTLAVSGSVLFNGGSTFSVNTNPNGTADKLAVTGTVTINTGATLQVLAGIATYPAAGISYTILTATGGISGKFDKAVTDYAYYNASVNTQKKGIITLNITPNGKPLPSAATAATFSTASAVESLGTSNALYQHVLGQSLLGARQAFDAFSGSSYARLDAQMSNDVGSIHLGLDQSESEVTPIEWSGVNALSARGVNSGSLSRHGGVSLFMLGGRYGTRLTSDSISGDVDTRFLGSAAGFRSGNFQALASVTSAWHDVSVARTIAFPGFAERTQSRYRAATHRIGLEGAYALTGGRIAIAPYAGVAHLTVSSPAFSESGGLSALAFEAETNAMDQLRLGVRAGARFGLWGIKFSPRLDASVERIWGAGAVARTARFSVGGNSFDSGAYGFNSRAALIDGGLDMEVGRFNISASYHALVGDQWSDRTAKLGASLKF